MDAVRRFTVLARIATSDTWRAGIRLAAWPEPGAEVPADALDAGTRWLCRTHDVTGRRGSSVGFSLVSEWGAAFPETTGYVIGTLLDRARATEDESLVVRAREMGDWEIDEQGDDGGVMQGVVTTRPRQSIVFNTGMVMHGWLDLHERLDEERFMSAARRGGDFLVRHQRPDGSWYGDVTYCRIPHAYNARVAWALARLGQATGDPTYTEAARRKLDWVVEQQRSDGWFEQCVFKPNTLPNTHGMAYTMRGLLESSQILDEPRYLDSAWLCARTLRGRYAELRRLPARFAPDWTARARWTCLTGLAQVGGVWLRLHQIGGDPAFRTAGLRAVEDAAGHQCRVPHPDLHGALAGSFPVYGLYAPLRFPNWATKFLVDSLALREAVLGGDGKDGRRKDVGDALRRVPVP